MGISWKDVVSGGMYSASKKVKKNNFYTKMFGGEKNTLAKGSIGFATMNPAMMADSAAQVKKDLATRKADGKSNRLYSIYLDKTGSTSAAGILDPAGAYDVKKSKERQVVKDAQKAQEVYNQEQLDYIQYQKDQAAKIAGDQESAEARATAMKEEELRRKRSGMSSTNTTMDPSTGQTMMSVQPFLKRKSVGRGQGYWA